MDNLTATEDPFLPIPPVKITDILAWARNAAMAHAVTIKNVLISITVPGIFDGMNKTLIHEKKH